MSFAFPEVDPNTSGSIYNVPVPMSRYLEESFSMGQHYTVLNSLNRMSEFSAANSDEDSPILDPETANQKYGVGNLKFDAPIRESVANLMNQRKKDEMDREYFLSQGSSAMRFIPGMAASMLGAVSNPLDLGLMFVPFVGSEEVAAKATGTMGRILARRLVTRETLAEVFPRAPGLTESVINGMVGQSMFEVPNLIASKLDRENYGFTQAALNIGAGGVLSAALHGLVYHMSKLGRGTRQAMARDALNQVLRDENIDVHRYVSIDESTIWDKVKFDQDVALSRAYESISAEDVAAAVRDKYGEKVQGPAVQMTDGTVHVGDSHESILAKYADSGIEPQARNYEEGFITDKGRFISREEAGKLVGLPDRGYNHLMWENDKLLSEQLSTANPEQLGTAEHDRYNQLIEENPHLSKSDALAQIVKEREGRRNRYLMEQPHIQELVERERKAAIAKFVEDERARFEREKQGIFEDLKQKEIERQISEGRILAPEEVQKSSPPEKFDGSDADLDFEIEGLKQDLKLEEMGVKADNSGFKEPKTEAINAAVDCITKKIL